MEGMGEKAGCWRTKRTRSRRRESKIFILFLFQDHPTSHPTSPYEAGKQRRAATVSSASRHEIHPSMTMPGQIRLARPHGVWVRAQRGWMGNPAPSLGGRRPQVRAISPRASCWHLCHLPTCSVEHWSRLELASRAESELLMPWAEQTKLTN